MTAVSYSDQLTGVMAVRIGSYDKGKQANDVITEVVLANLYSPQYDFSFPKIVQSKFGVDNGHRYHNVSKERALIKSIYPRLGLFIASFFCSLNPLVELGAGVPDSEGNTLLSKVMPNKFKLTFTDNNPVVVKTGKEIVPSFQMCDASDLRNSKERQFAACNLIDTWSDETLMSFLNNLPSNSTFVHFNDLTPLINRFAWDLSKEHKFFIPYFEGNEFIGAIIINDYKKIRPSLIHSLNEMELNFLDEMNGYSSEQKEHAFNIILKAQNDALSLWIRKAIPQENLIVVSITAHFETRLKNIKHPQITKLFCGTVKLSEIVDKEASRGNSLINRLHFNGSYCRLSKIYVLAPGKEQIVAEITLLAINKSN